MEKPDSFIMLDLETEGVSFGATLLQISMVEFDLEGRIGESFTVNVDPQSCQAIGLRSDESTIKFWAGQPKVVQDTLLPNRLPIHCALRKSAEFIAKYPDAFIWGNGVRADNVWFLSACRAAGIADPFAYNKDMCFRTLKKLARKKRPDLEDQVPFVGLPHYSLDDCFHQIKLAQLYWKVLNDSSGT